MKTLRILAGAALVSGLLLTSSFASLESYNARYNARYGVPRTDIPLPAKVVHPTDLPRCYEGATITLTFTVDPTGQPRDITAVSPVNPDLARRIIPVFAQWRFTPAQKDGVPVAARVQLPLQLVAGY